jgi:hypothetical protein
LRQNFSQISDNKRLHFYNDNVRILARHPISATSTGERPVPEDDTVVAGGSFHTKTPDAITDMIKRIWGNDAPLFHMKTHDESVENIIKKLQYERVSQILSEKQDWMSEVELANTLHLQSVGTINVMKQVLRLLVEQAEIEEQAETTSDANVQKRYRIRTNSNAESAS